MEEELIEIDYRYPGLKCPFKKGDYVKTTWLAHRKMIVVDVTPSVHSTIGTHIITTALSEGKTGSFYSTDLLPDPN